MNKDKILNKIQMLLNLSQSDNINEAANAAAHAQRLMNKYKLTSLMIESASDSLEPDEDIVDFSKKGAPLISFNKAVSTWKSRLAMIVAEANHCRVYIDRTSGCPEVALVGRPSDAETVRYLYSFLLREVDRLTKRDGLGCGKDWSNNFRLGALDTIKKRLQVAADAGAEDFRGAAARTGTALVHVSSAIEKFEKRGKSVDDWVGKNLKLGKAKKIRSNYIPSAREAGKKAAKEINLDRNKQFAINRKKLAS